MSTHVTRSESSDAMNSGNNLEEDTEPTPPETKYKLEDFSQSAINRGQRYINYEFVVVNDRIVEALEAIRDVISGGPGGPATDLEAVNEAISEVQKANSKVAGWYPPGCGSGSGSGGTTTTGETGGDTGGPTTPTTTTT